MCVRPAEEEDEFESEESNEDYTRSQHDSLSELENVGTSKYMPPHLREGAKPSLEAQRMKEGKCKYCGEKWDPKHRC